jgi:hypothetical protein
MFGRQYFQATFNLMFKSLVTKLSLVMPASQAQLGKLNEARVITFYLSTRLSFKAKVEFINT